MKAMILPRIVNLDDSPAPLQLVDLPIPEPQAGEVSLAIMACGVCHTELDEIEGRTPPPRLPVVPGHQVVGRVHSLAPGVSGLAVGQRVGVAWIHSACGTCTYCLRGEENLCPRFSGTGRDVNGGYAEYMTVPAAFVYPIPAVFSDAEAAPLLCAGAVGWRSVRLSGLQDGQSLGLAGFGASGHLVLQLVRHRFPATKVFVFARNSAERRFALELGAVWAGDFDEYAPVPLARVIDTTPAWRPIVASLRNLGPGGTLIVNAIRKEGADQSALLELDYGKDLWMEKSIKSVANVSRADVAEFLDVAAGIPLKPEIEEFDLADANRALVELKRREIRGAKVLLLA